MRSNPAFLQSMHRLNSRECLVLGETLGEFMSNIVRLETYNRAELIEMEATSRFDLSMAYGYPDSDTDTSRKPFLFHEGVAIIPVHGTLLNRFNASYGFATGYNFLRRVHNAALADADVDLIAFDIHCPGGDSAGCFELAREILAGRAIKPSIAIVDSVMASGGLALGACATRVVATPSSRIGSIGVYRQHTDISAMLEKDGVVMSYAVAGEHKLDGQPERPISDEVLAEWTEQAGVVWDEFIDLVAEARDLDPQAVRDTQARVYRAQEALDLGLIDEVKTPTEAIAAFVAELANDDLSDEDDDMTTKTTPAAAAPAATEVASVTNDMIAAAVASALAAEKQRTCAIISSDEGKARPNLAQVLATTTSLTADEARAVLGAAAVETKVKADRVSADPEDGDDEEDDDIEDDADDAEDDLEDDDADGEDEQAAMPKKTGKAKGKMPVKGKGKRAPLQKVASVDQTNHLSAVMERSRHPNVGSGRSRDNDNLGDDSKMAAGILADLTAVTGARWGEKKTA